MPSTVIGNPVASGPQPLISGNVFSGNILSGDGIRTPVTGVRVFCPWDASGAFYVGTLPTIRLTSGGFLLSGRAGLLDGVSIGPGQNYLVPKGQIIPPAVDVSGELNIYIRHDAAVSGMRIFWNVE